MLRLHHTGISAAMLGHSGLVLAPSLCTHFHPWAGHADTQAAHAASWPRELAQVKTKPILS